MVECECVITPIFINAFIVLIDTWWNVNHIQQGHG